MPKPIEAHTPSVKPAEPAPVVEPPTPAATVPPKPHELRAELLKKEKELDRARRDAAEQEGVFGSKAGDIEAELEEVRERPASPRNDAERKRLQDSLREAEKKGEGGKEIESGKLTGTLLK